MILWIIHSADNIKLLSHRFCSADNMKSRIIHSEDKMKLWIIYSADNIKSYSYIPQLLTIITLLLSTKNLYLQQRDSRKITIIEWIREYNNHCLSCRWWQFTRSMSRGGGLAFSNNSLIYVVRERIPEDEVSSKDDLTRLGFLWWRPTSGHPFVIMPGCELL